MKLPAIIQVRNGSSRFPHKVMKEVLGKPLLWYLCERIKRMDVISDCIVATSIEKDDDEISFWCERQNISCFRGDNEDVLHRIVSCAQTYNIETCVKFWGDSPLIDISLVNMIVGEYERRYQHVVYLSNNHPSTYPEGMQVEIINIHALKSAQIASDLRDMDREHVTSYIWMRPEVFPQANISTNPDIHDAYRFVLDYPEDFEQIRHIIMSLWPNTHMFGLSEMIDFLDIHPEIKAINMKWYESSKDYNARVFYG